MAIFAETIRTDALECLQPTHSMKLHRLTIALVAAFTRSLFAAQSVAITVIEDFSDPKDNPQFNADVASAQRPDNVRERS